MTGGGGPSGGKETRRPKGRALLFAGDYEVVGPNPALGFDVVASLSVDLVFIHYHHRHEFQGGANKGLWGSVCRGPGVAPSWVELDRVVAEAKRAFPMVALYPIGWAHMVPEHLGSTILDVPPDVVGKWVATVVERYDHIVDLFPIFYEINVFDLFFRATHHQPYGMREKQHVVKCLVSAVKAVRHRCGASAVQKLTAATFVELTNSSFYWMSEGKLLELPHGSALTKAPLSPPDLIETARSLDKIDPNSGYETEVRGLLRRLVFWNADDSGANDTVADDLRRIERAAWFHHPVSNPQGFVESLICGWDAQPQNSYEYLVKRLQPNVRVPTCATQLERNWLELCALLEGPALPDYVRAAVKGFVLDDVFKCTKQTGVTSAVHPSERVGDDGLRIGDIPLTISPIGNRYAEIISTYHGQDKTTGADHAACVA